MESLVGKLRQQTLETQEEDCSTDWKASVPVAQDRMTELVQEPFGMAMNIDPDQGGSAETTKTLPRSLDMMRMHRKFSRRDYLRAPRPGSVAASSMQLVQPPTMAPPIEDSATAKPHPVFERNLPTMAVEPVVDMSFLELEADEGYCEGADDMSWLADSASMNGMSRAVRSNSLLKFRTSTEAALQCSLLYVTATTGVIWTLMRRATGPLLTLDRPRILT
ncbi:hypothetical protein HRG_007006 [Hirsutella rhossiliensis]|uniref:Uncharacterized protein n=1 Tax=Hirsutella rhossiliensis TaxID=111463 RepID=A0A9P8SID8_9HYPO|nr:uncharacterized protein HRG_07006 [Hirsutella rhossiliensis]KAH0961926.1 hypothetical protein HRG_07006 [Hirsutella rhossiliensis]